MKIPQELRYTKSHEWAQKTDQGICVGITDYAQHEISDIVFVELPKVGTLIQQAKSVCVIESVKAAFDIYAPLSGKVSEVNPNLESDPAMVNEDCYGRGWLFKISAEDITGWTSLLTPEQYEEHLKQGAK